jgi:hypothetical protein
VSEARKSDEDMMQQMEGRMSVQERKQTSHVKVATASLIGTAIEWYDFFLYGTAAALIFNKLFFPTFDPWVGTLLAFPPTHWVSWHGLWAA